MSVIHVDLTRSDDRRDVVHRAVQMLAEGKLVVLPSETVYGVAASSLCPQAVERLLEVKGRARSEGVSADLEINGLLGATLRLFGGPSTLRATLGYGLAGDSRQDRLSGSLFLNFRQ